MATLQEGLDAIRADFESQASVDALAVVHRATQELVESGQVNRAHGEGDVFPEFELPDANGALVASKSLRAHGPFVLTVFRGKW